MKEIRPADIGVGKSGQDIYITVPMVKGGFARGREALTLLLDRQQAAVLRNMIDQLLKERADA